MQENVYLEEAAKLTQLAYWEWDLLTNTIVWSDEIYHIFGEKAQSFVPTLKRGISFLSPECQLSIQQSFSYAIKNKEAYQLDCEILRRNGQIRYIQSTVQAKFDTDSKPISMSGTLLDVTAQNELENKVKSLSHIIENSINEVYVFNAKNLNLTYVNDSGLKKTGYTFEEMKEMTPADIKPSYTIESFLTLIEPLLDGSEKYLTFQTIHQSKNGSEYNVEIRIQSMEINDNQELVVIAQDITERICLEERLRKLATIDSLTGIYNRHKINKELDIEIERAQRYKSTFALLMFDLDNFKMINDTYGHHAGDYVLKEVSTIIQSNLRESDRFGRWGGEEFIIILPELDKRRVISVSKKIKESIAQYSFEGISQITISVGASVFNENDTNDGILKRVDDALYEAKNAGRNIVRFF